jgi:hypothetical protein
MKGPFVAACITALGLGAGACGGSSPSGFATTGMPGIPSPARIGANLVLAEVDVNGQSGPLLLVDTGSPFTLIDPSQYPAISFPTAPQISVDLTFGVFTVEKVPAIQTNFLDSSNVPEIVGGNLMRQFPVQIDYSERDPSRAFRLGASNMTATGVEMPGGTVMFTLQGGGRGPISDVTQTIVSTPATRIPLTVDIEGTSSPCILDTGASEVTVRQAVFDMLTADGRAQLAGLPIGTAMGPADAHVTRAKTVTLAGQTVTNPAVMTIGDTGETLLDALSREIGHPVNCLLGGSYLREFLVTIDYPNGTLQLQRYSPPLAIEDEFKRVGIEIGPGTGGHGYAVAVVYPGTDAAAKMLSVGDEILSIDGQSLASLDAIQVDDALDGMVGTTKQLGLGATKIPALTNTTITVMVDDLIPAPSP